jgi:hypothetical protein
VTAHLKGKQTMRIRTGLGTLICCAALAGCTAAAPKGPDTTVTTPAVGRPPAPASVQAAQSSEAFTPYASLGAVSDDGLAPGDTYTALHTACMNDAGYGQYAASAPFFAVGPPAMVEAWPFGWYGYLGAAEAAQDGFNVQVADPAAQDMGDSSAALASLPPGAQAAANKCANIVSDFQSAQFTTSLAGIGTMNTVIGNDEVQDPDVTNAMKAWSACMARNGYTASNANTLANQELVAVGLKLAPPPPGSGAIPVVSPSPTAAQYKAQIATAVADADCTQATDLAGIFFAVQGSYEQQVVTANQQALNAAVRQYKASYAKELSKLPSLLRTTSATPNLSRPGKPGTPGHPGKHSTPTPTRS